MDWRGLIPRRRRGSGPAGRTASVESLILDPQIVGFALEQAEQGLESSTEVGGRRGTKLEDGDQVFLEAVHPAPGVERFERRKMLQGRGRPFQALAAEVVDLARRTSDRRRTRGSTDGVGAGRPPAARPGRHHPAASRRGGAAKAVPAVPRPPGRPAGRAARSAPRSIPGTGSRPGAAVGPTRPRAPPTARRSWPPPPGHAPAAGRPRSAPRRRRPGSPGPRRTSTRRDSRPATRRR